jgi:ubiquinol-cytochrome c reductase cytochrome b subunit
LHLWLVLRKGISAAPVPGQIVDPKSYDAAYEREVEKGVPFIGEPAQKDAVFSAVVVLVVCAIAAWAGPKGPGEMPEPSLLGANPRPDWPFPWLFALLALSPPNAETVIMLVLPLLLIGGLFLVPFVSNRGERAPSRRPVAVLGVIVVASALVILTYLGDTSPWSPVMNGWSGYPVPEEIVRRATPVQLMGAAMFQNKQCRNCHALDGLGGHRGPDLTDVGLRLTPDQLIDQVSTGTPGGGYMPAYGKQIKPDEMAVLVEFLSSLRPPGVPAPRSPAAPQP